MILFNDFLKINWKIDSNHSHALVHWNFWLNISICIFAIVWFEFYKRVSNICFILFVSIKSFYNTLQSRIRFLMTPYFSVMILLQSSTNFWFFSSSAFCSFNFCDCLSMLFKYMLSLSWSCLFCCYKLTCPHPFCTTYYIFC